jgi:RNA polymerase sigma-70 factor (ECF subfamily)
MDPEALYQETELEYRVFQIVSGLPSRCKEIFTLSRVEGKKNSEIAARLKISIRTVETQISKAIKILRQKLE